MKIKNNSLSSYEINEINNLLNQKFGDDIKKLINEYDKLLTEIFIEAIMSKIISKEVYKLSSEAIRVVATCDYEIDIVNETGKSIISGEVYRATGSSSGKFLKKLPILSNDEMDKLKSLGVEVSTGYRSRIYIKESFLSKEISNKINSLIKKIIELDNKRKSIYRFNVNNIERVIKGTLTIKKLYQYDKDFYDVIMKEKLQSLDNVDIAKLTPVEKINLLRLKLGD